MRSTLITIGLLLITTVRGQDKALTISPSGLKAMLGQPGLYVFDCNEQDLYAEAHVPGAKLLVYDAVTADKLPADKGATLVFYCYSPECPASHGAARVAMSLGFHRVYVMPEGIRGWQDAGLSTEP